jgi:hypothetical protein
MGLRAEADRVHLSYRVRINGGEWEDVAETVRIVRVPCRLGGSRPYFICPGVVDGVRVGGVSPSCTAPAAISSVAIVIALPTRAKAKASEIGLSGVPTRSGSASGASLAQTHRSRQGHQTCGAAPMNDSGIRLSMPRRRGAMPR